MTHQIGAVQGAARENTSQLHTAAHQQLPGNSVLVLLSSGHYMYYCIVHIGLCHHLVGWGDITLFSVLDCGNRGVMCS